jgi:hypothetical protein
MISHSHQNFIQKRKYDERYTFSGGSFFELMKELGLYTTDIGEIASRVELAGLTNMFGSALS